MERIKELALSYFSQIVAYRRHFHQYPELAGKEKETAAYIRAVLDSIGIPYTKDVAGHGIIAVLQGALPGHKTVALRADMDALPVQEETGLPYMSRVPGVMHACGHDVHMASLLGALQILHDSRHTFGGTIKAIFQPSEEEYDGGAPFMIEEGVLENPTVDVIFAQHVTPGIETGSIGLREGPFMASTDEIHLTVRGKGGHAALTREVVNPIEVGMAIMQDLQLFVKEHQQNEIPAILSFGRFIADGRPNLIPDQARLSGTLRTFDEEWRGTVLSRIETRATEIARRFGATCDIDNRSGYPVLINDPETTRRVRQYAEDFLGMDKVLTLPCRMTAEDFSYYLQKRAGTFYRLGTTCSHNSSLHSSRLLIDENALLTGMGLLSWIAINELN